MNAMKLLTHFFLWANGLILLSFGVTRAFEIARRLLGIKFDFRQSTRFEQLLFLCPLLLAIALTVVPTKTAILPFGIREPMVESIESLDRRISKPLIVTTVEKRISNRVSDNSTRSLSIADCLSLLALAILLLNILSLGIRILRLQKVIANSLVLKCVGRVRIAVSSSTAVPFSVWLWSKAWVVMPESLLGDLAQYRISLLHELEHHRAQDTKWAFFIEFLQPIYFANPIFYLWKSRIAEIQEFSCDENLIGRRKLALREYGGCLLQVAEAALHRHPRFIGIAGMAGNNNPTTLERRIQMFKHYSKRRPNSKMLPVLVIAALLSVSVAGFALKSSTASTLFSDTPNPGELGLDADSQAITQKILDEAVRNFKAASGFAVVGEAKTGRILAVADIAPDPAQPKSPHWPLALRIEPASVMKAIVSAAAIEAGATQPWETHNCENQKYILDGVEFGDWKSFGTLTTAESVEQSSNICGIKIGLKLGGAGVTKALRQFGFGPGGTSAGIPGARSGILPLSEEMGEKKFIAQVTTGYRFYTTPLEVVQAFGAIANGGELMTPTPGNTKAAPVPLRRILSEKSAKEMREILLGVMTRGTAMKSQSKKFTLGGKTGTGRSPWIMNQETNLKDSEIAHFVGFGPFENPELVVYVGIMDPKNEPDHKAHGASHAAPVFRDLMEALLQFRHKS